MSYARIYECLPQEQFQPTDRQENKNIELRPEKQYFKKRGYFFRFYVNKIKINSSTNSVVNQDLSE